MDGSSRWWIFARQAVCSGAFALGVTGPAMTAAVLLAAEPEIVISDDAAPGASPAPLARPQGARPLRPVAGQPEAELAAAQRPVRAEATRFQEVEPGVTTAAELRRLWGEAKATAGEAQAPVLSFARDGFSRVEVQLSNNVVQAIVIHLDAALSRTDAAQQLELAGFDPLDVRDERGTRIGLSFPERGVLLSFADNAPAGREPNVRQIVLEPIAAEPFLLRVTGDRGHHYRRSLSDLDLVLHLEPNNSKAYALRAEILESAGRPGDAVGAAAEAVRLAPKEHTYRLLWARLLASGGQLPRAVEEAKAVASADDAGPSTKARAACLLGDFHLQFAPPKTSDAVKQYTAAIQLAAEIGKDPRPPVRRAGKRVLVDAHLGMAQAIAHGQWQKKGEATAKWLGNAGQFAEDLIENEGASDSLRFAVSCRSLAVFVGEPKLFDPAGAAAAVVEGGQKLIESESDTLRQGEIRAETALALARAAFIEHSRGKSDVALRHAALAAAAQDELPATRQSSRQHDFELGRVYFVCGFVYADKKKDHHRAVGWFEKAAPLLSGPLPESFAGADGMVGDWLVSMGISYWQTGRHTQAVELTEAGLKRIQASVRAGLTPEQTLAVPYANLASMLKTLGNAQAARNYAALAQRLEEKQATKQR